MINLTQEQQAPVSRLNYRGNQGSRLLGESNPQISDDLKFWNALMVLDAAEHGFFWADGERVFDELDEPEPNTYNYVDYEHDNDAYYDDHYNLEEYR